MALHMNVVLVVMYLKIIAIQLIQKKFMKTLTLKLVKAVVLGIALNRQEYCVILNMTV